MVKTSEKYSTGNKVLLRQSIIYLITVGVFYGVFYFSFIAKKPSYENVGSINQNFSQYSYSK